VNDSPRKPWNPTLVRRHIESYPTSVGTMQVSTDAGDGYLKAMGNPAGEHALACELVGTQLAAWLGLSVFDFAIVQVADVPDLPFANGGQAEPGPGFITRKEPGETWGGSERELRMLINPEDISRLIVFDTWSLNCDRHAPDGIWKPNRNNVFLSEEAPKGQLVLRAMDHTHCFTWGQEITRRIATIERVKDPRVYGRFPEFVDFLDQTVVQRAVVRLREASHGMLANIVHAIPPEWHVNDDGRNALTDLLLGRAAYVADHIMEWLWPQREFGYMSDSEDVR
jgi:HipA-like kinase